MVDWSISEEFIADVASNSIAHGKMSDGTSVEEEEKQKEEKEKENVKQHSACVSKVVDDQARELTDRYGMIF